MKKLDQYAFVLWKDYDAVGLCKPPEDNENPHVTAAVGAAYARYPIAVVGEVYGRGWGEGKVILTRPIAKIEGNRVETDTGVEYLLEQKHPDYLAYEKALLTLHGGTKVFVDVFAISRTQKSYIYEFNETIENVVIEKAIGRAFCGYKGAWLLDLYANDLSQCGVGGAPFLTAKRAKELGII